MDTAEAKTLWFPLRQARVRGLSGGAMNHPSEEIFLRFVLRWIGTVSLLALFAVVMPYAWMDATHYWLGLGRLPDQPIVGYLARSVSAFYALLGGLLWVISFDLPRHRPTLCYLGVAIMVFGATLTGIDWVEGLPLFWRVWEGPWVMLMGAAIAWCAARIKPHASDGESPSHQ